ncbi:hypothetical protein D046_3559B, partial [Vibrio parahaemolyticus V-223/04]
PRLGRWTWIAVGGN